MFPEGTRRKIKDPGGWKSKPSLKSTETRARTQLNLKIKIMTNTSVSLPLGVQTSQPQRYYFWSFFKVLPNVKTKIETQIETEL